MMELAIGIEWLADARVVASGSGVYGQAANSGMEIIKLLSSAA
jgi:hypothetical protein